MPEKDVEQVLNFNRIWRWRWHWRTARMNVYVYPYCNFTVKNRL